MSQSLHHLTPDPQFHIHMDTSAEIFSLNFKGSQISSLPLSLGAIHSLFKAVDNALLLDGLSLRISRKSLATPLGFEALLQVIMMNMVSCVFPRLRGWSPLRKNFQLLHLDAEINNIRNAAHWNAINHVFSLRNSLANKPLLIALPGPSLDLDYIREFRSSYVLMSAGRGAKELLTAGIYPDFIYIQDIQSFAWHNNFNVVEDTPIPSVLVANPLGRIWKYSHLFKRVYKAWNIYPFERDCFPKLDEIAPSSVSGAYSLARLLGADPIVFIGNDCGRIANQPTETIIPQSLTNLDFKTVGDDLIFTPTKYLRNLYLHFGDDLSVATQNDYLAGAHWLKIMANQDIRQYGIKIYDRSHTKFSQFHSKIQDAAQYMPQQISNQGNQPAYTTNYDIQKYLKHKQNAYEFILRKLSVGLVPKSTLQAPLSSVLTNTSLALTDSVNPTAEDFEIAKSNAAQLVEHAETALAILG